ncbi:MAG: hypothetical protein NUV47_00235 [Patescibacteria group bacterium]|nr:hypothetical protein [Patescibacteria group bacterium]
MQKKTTKINSTAMELGILGASIAGIAAAYFFLGPKGKKHQKQMKVWAIKMKADVVEKLEEARDISEPIFHQIIDSIAEEYEQKAKIGREEIQLLAKDLKKHWKLISKEAGIDK